MDHVLPEFPICDLEGALEAKHDLIQSYERELSKSQLEEAKRDYHSKKAPYPACGMTVHPATGCSSHCLYCYVPEHQVKISPLNGKQMAYSLLRSPFFFPGKNGTFLALGSITDPFLPQVRDTSFAILREIHTRLGNPLQIATKQTLSVSALKDLDPNFLSQTCLLVSLSSWKSAEHLEPHVPTPQERLGFVKAVRTEGGSPFVFLRPMIPGITSEESESIILALLDATPRGVVLGSLKLNHATLERLRLTIDVTEITRRLPSSILSKGFQYIYTADLKQTLSDRIKTSGVQPLHSACCANAASHAVPCVNACWTNPKICSDCWNRCSDYSLPEMPDSAELQEFIQRWLNKPSSATIDDENRLVRLTVKRSPAMRIGIKRSLETLLRATVVVSPKKGL
ncbi:MAG: hypothetical protein ACE5OZ_19710 [Candidatus Heimdallarchaeota archaeon]